jgi:hypothetical protein
MASRIARLPWADRPEAAALLGELTVLSAHRGQAIRAWVTRNKVELSFTRTYSSWATSIAA